MAELLEDSKTKRYLSVLFICFIGVVILASLYRYVQMRDFDAYFNVPCDPETESCFMLTYECEEGEDAQCTDPYKVLVVPASLLNTCVIDEGECLADICDASGTCAYFDCNEETQEYLGVYDECSTF